MVYNLSPTFCELFLSLPCELRDMIYGLVVSRSQPQRLDGIELPSLADPDIAGRTISAEACQAYGRYNTFVVYFGPTRQPIPARCWGAFGALLKPVIRELIVEAEEPAICFETVRYYESELFNSKERQMWQSLLSLPCLQSLEVRLRSHYFRQVLWYPYGPVLHQLRHKRPGLDFAFVVFNATVMNTFTAGHRFNLEGSNSLHLQNLFKEPQEYHWKHVERLERQMRFRHRLIDFYTPRYESNAEYSPGFFGAGLLVWRVLLWEHWKIYQSLEAERAAQEERSGSHVVKDSGKA